MATSDSVADSAGANRTEAGEAATAAPGSCDPTQLRQQFSKIVAHSDPLERELALLEVARGHDLDPAACRRLFDIYLEQTEGLKPGLTELLDRPFRALSGWLDNLSFFGFLEYVGRLAILLAIISYMVHIPDRRRQAIASLHAVVAEAEGRVVSSQRVQALEGLNDRCVGLEGLQAENADLRGLRLLPCRHATPFGLSWSKPLLGLFTVEGARLPYARLAGARLDGATLVKADFSHAVLRGASLRNADLRGANLTGADLEGADIFGARLDGANLSRANLKLADLSTARLKDADLSEADLTGTRLIQAMLPGARLYRANLHDANLSRADLRGANFYKAELENALLRHADLRQGASLQSAILAKADLFRVRVDSPDQLSNAVDAQWRQTDPGPPQIGLVVQLHDAFFEQAAVGVRQAAAEAGYEVLIRSSDENYQSEAAVIEELVVAGVDAVVLSAVDPRTSLEAVRSAFDSGVVLSCYNTCVDPDIAPGLVSGRFASDQTRLGYETGLRLAQWWRLHGRRGAQLPLGVVHCSSFDECYQRYLGMRSALEDSGLPWREVALREGSNLDDGRAAAAAVLAAHPDIEVLWAANEGGTEGSVLASRALLPQRHVRVFGTDVSPRIEAMLEADDAVLQAITAQNPEEMGYRAARAAIAVLEGTLPDSGNAADRLVVVETESQTRQDAAR